MKKEFVILSVAILTSISSIAQSNDSLKCPDLKIEGPFKEIIVDGKNANFTVGMQKLFESTDITYNWAVSNGTIIAGQGTKSITVDTKGLSGQLIITSVEVSGLNVTCDNVKSLTIKVIEKK